MIRMLAILALSLLVGAASRADDRPKPATTPEEAFTRFADTLPAFLHHRLAR